MDSANNPPPADPRALLPQEECGCCNGLGEVLMVRPMTGPTQIERCTNCDGFGVVFQVGTFVITFRRSDELPPVRWKSRKELGHD